MKAISSFWRFVLFYSHELHPGQKKYWGEVAMVSSRNRSIRKNFSQNVSAIGLHQVRQVVLNLYIPCMPEIA